MCGLAGIIGNFISNKDIDIYKQLLILAGFRGHHSTGTIFIDREKFDKPVQGKYYKEATNPFSYTLGEGFNKAERECGVIRGLVGHARWATKGAVTVKNAHPFLSGHTIGVHNGTLFGEYDYQKEYDTDSEALIRNIDEKGLKEGLEHINDKGGGAYALVLFNAKTGKITFLRNKERPFYFVQTKWNSSLIWASEKSMLEFIIKKHNLSIDGEIGMLKENTALTYDLNKADFLKDPEVEEAVVSNQRFFQTTSTTSYYGGSGQKYDTEWYKSWQKKEDEKKSATGKNWSDLEDVEDMEWVNEYGGYYTKKTTSSLTTNPDDQQGKKNENNVVPLIPLQQKPKGSSIVKSEDHWYTGYKGHQLLRSQAVSLLNKGCCWCAQPSQINDPVRWIARDHFVCGDCKEDPSVIEYMSAV